MAEVKGLGIPQTKGTFQVRGIVTGVEKDNFFVEKTTKTNKQWRAVNFGVKVNTDKTIYISLNGMERDKVYFSKQVEENGKKKTEVKDVAWKYRDSFNEEGFRLMGINLGLNKIDDGKGNMVNDKKVMVEYDACGHIANNLQDDMSVFIKGNIEYSHYESNDSVRRGVKFIPTQISLCKNDIDFKDEDFKEISNFDQHIIFQKVDKQDNKFVVDAKIVNYNTIEEAEFIINDEILAKTFKKNLKPYNSLVVSGAISVETKTSEVQDESEIWGEPNPMKKINSPVQRELVIKGADPSTIDKVTYLEDILEEAAARMNANKKADKEYGEDSPPWGDDKKSAAKDDEEEWDF